MKKVVGWSMLIFILVLVGGLVFAYWYDENHRKGSYVICDIGIGDAYRGVVVAEDSERIFIRGQRQCLMYCRNAPYGDEEQLDEMMVTEEYKKWYPDEDVQWKSLCYRSGNDVDKMKAISEWRGWMDEENKD